MNNDFNPIELATTSKTFCIMPWIHQYVGPVGDIKPCCVYQHEAELGSLKENTLEEIWNSDASKQLRLKLLNNEIEPNCNRCEHIDVRTGLNQKFFQKNKDIVQSTLSDGSIAEHKLVYMDVRFNNLCNFSCRTCSPHFSTNWVMDYRKLHNLANTENTNLFHDGYHFPGKTEAQALEEILPHLKNMQEIYFAGGEPMMQEEHYKVLQKLIEVDNVNCIIRYNTNFSKLKLGQHDVIEYWKHFDNIYLCTSIDGSHSKAEYWRHGTDWQTIVDNRIRLMNEIPNIPFHIAYTLSWVNAHNLVEFHKEWIELGYLTPNNIDISLLAGPEYYSLQNIPDWKKQQIETLFREHMKWLVSLDKPTDLVVSLYEAAITYMWKISGDVNENLKHFNRITTKLDSLRQESFFETFPEHIDILDYMTLNNLRATFDY